MAFRIRCRCGCGALVTRPAYYRPGHDGKHRGQLRAAGATPEQADTELPTDALRAQYRADYESRKSQ